MKNLFDRNAAADFKARLQKLRTDSQPQWGTMNAAQAVAHCATAMEQALGDWHVPRMFIGRLIGWMIKPLALGDDKPMRRNSPTVPVMVVADQRDLDVERQRLSGLIDRFVAGGPAGVTKNVHGFFGHMKPEEWAVLMYKHVDHHLRQFGA